MLDEVDAALDNLNVAKVAAFIRSRSQEESKAQDKAGKNVGFQSVVISLKDTFYDKADALVGVYRDSEKRSVGFLSAYHLICSLIKYLRHVLAAAVPGHSPLILPSTVVSDDL